MRRFNSWDGAVGAFLTSLEIGREKLTIRNVRNRLDHFTRAFEFESIRRMRARAYSRWINELQNTLAPSSAKGVHADVVRFLRWLKHPHAQDIALLRVTAPEKAIAVYTEDQLSKLIGWALGEHHSLVKRRLAVYIAIVATSGMRPSECCSLRWSNWNEEDGTFRLLETKTRVARWAKVHPGVIPLLRRWRDETGSPWVIPHLQMPAMKLEAPHPIQAELRRLGKKLEIPNINSKRFRSTVVKRVIEAGGSYEDAAAVVGHASIATTAKHYHRIQLGRRARDAHEAAFQSIDIGGNGT